MKITSVKKKKKKKKKEKCEMKIAQQKLRWLNI